MLRERVPLAFGGQAGSAAESGMVRHPRAHESRGRGKWQSSEEREAEMLPPLPAWVFFFPCEFPAIQLNSDAVFPETALDSTGEGPSLTRPPSALDANPKPGSCLGFGRTGCESEVPVIPSLGSVHLLEHLAELGKGFIPQIHVLLQKTLGGTNRQPDETARGGGLSRGASDPVTLEAGHGDIRIRSGSPALHTPSLVFLEASLH